ncbi:hypothetical protein ACTNE3_07395 [Bacillota bacterium HCP3S3_F1_1]|nr:hypothetical protein [Bacillota bacterium]CCX66319.1 uncharacterized protein BN785_00303 [Firmicutes bacterium CAG:791]MCI6594726.1 hypothetical protein [Bacillota bacterium]MDD7254177.1 hypothetical protein [Bacillota bacterium]MDD7254220.1 hypothetical protein [Bacillota bacterium]
MPRGRKKKPESVEEQMQLVQAEIEELSAKLKAKKKEMAVLEKAKKAEEQQKLLDAVAASGKSVDEIIGMLQ